MTRGAQPLLLIDDGRELFHAANRALERLGRWRPLMLIPQYAAARRYITDSLDDGRPPVAIIIRAHDADAAPLALLDWLREQPEPLCSTQVLVITDDVMEECEGTLDACMESAFRQLLGVPEEHPNTRDPHDHSRRQVGT